MFAFEKKISAVARKGALYSASAILVFVGAAFLTVAAWLLLTELKSTLFAATVIGATYAGLGLIGFAIASASSQPPTTPKTPNDTLNGLSPMQLMVVTFLQGFERGAKAKRESRSEKT
jgi:hypothetical protein